MESLDVSARVLIVVVVVVVVVLPSNWNYQCEKRLITLDKYGCNQYHNRYK
ncbi:hypothetical protein N9L68_09420 [bacterium]|nr:hypothetical protein [bacterium]